METQKKSLLDLLKEKSINRKLDDRRLVQEKIAEAISDFLDYNPVLSSLRLKETLGKINTGYMCDYFFCMPSHNPVIKNNASFEYMTLKDAVNIILNAPLDLQIVIETRGRPQDLPHYKGFEKTVLYYKDETKMLEFVQKNLSAEPIKRIHIHPYNIKNFI